MWVRAKEDCFVDNGYRVEGTEFEYNGPKKKYLELLEGTWPEVDVENDEAFA